MWLMSFIFSAISDYFINNKIVSIVVARKIGNTVGKLSQYIYCKLKPNIIMLHHIARQDYITDDLF